MKYLSVFICLLTSHSMCSAKSRGNDHVVMIHVGTLFSANQPYEELVGALSRNKKTKLFRVSWDSNGSLSRNGMTALYNRKLHTLKYYSVEHSLIDDETGKYRHTYEHTIYRGVTDSILQRLAAKNRSAAQGDISSFFAQLPQFGCRKRRLRYDVTYTIPRQ